MKIKLIIPGSHDHIRLAGKAFKGVLEEVLHDDETLFLMELAVSEAIANCIKHAYKNRSGNTVEVEIELNETQVLIRVKDEGKKPDPDFLKNCSFKPSCDPGFIEGGGRGVPIINEVMDEVDYYSSCEKNILVMKKIIPHRKK